MPGVFDGIKVLDFTWVIAGPLSTKYLSDHGATIIRVEYRAHPCHVRTSPPWTSGALEIDHSAYFALYNANKLSLSLNTNHPRAKEVLKRLVSWADIVAENFVPGIMERWGLGYEDLKKIKPDIIMYRAAGYGQTGPYSSLKGTGVNFVGPSGFAHLTGWAGREPCQPYGPYTDVIAPKFGASMLIAALDYRRRTGKGQMLDLAQYEAAINFLVPPLLACVSSGNITDKRGNLDSLACPHAAYPCRDEDSWCVIAVSTGEEWKDFCCVIGNPALSNDERFVTLAARKENETDLDKLVAEWTIQHTAEEITVLMQKQGVPAFKVQTCKDLYEDPQLSHRGHFVHLDHKIMGPITHLNQPFKLSKTPAEIKRPAPCLGQDTEHVCLDILGMSQSEFDELLIDGVFD